MGAIDSFLRKLWQRVPAMFFVFGLAFLGFNRKAAQWEASTGGELPGPVFGITFIVIGVLVWGFQVYQRSSGEKKAVQAE